MITLSINHSNKKPVQRVKDPIISVIVPIYNVESCVRKCLESLAQQTMKEIEIICIDDGSTDNSGQIADEYAADPRFIILHTTNKGLSAARNLGINQSHGQFLMFVDGDDWVEKEFCEKPYNASQKYDADLILFQTYKVKNGKVKWTEPKHRLSTGIIDEFTAYELGADIVWNKLYKRELFDTIRYPENRIFEDIAITHKLIHAAKNIIYLSDYLYYYVYRKESITNKLIKKYKRDRLISAFEKRDDLISYGFPEKKLNDSLCGYVIGFLASIQSCDDLLYQKAKAFLNSIEGIPKSITGRQILALTAWRIDERLFFLLSRLTGKHKA